MASYHFFIDDCVFVYLKKKKIMSITQNLCKEIDMNIIDKMK